MYGDISTTTSSAPVLSLICLVVASNGYSRSAKHQESRKIGVLDFFDPPISAIFSDFERIF